MNWETPTCHLCSWCLEKNTKTAIRECRRNFATSPSTTWKKSRWKKFNGQSGSWRLEETYPVQICRRNAFLGLNRPWNPVLGLSNPGGGGAWRFMWISMPNFSSLGQTVCWYTNMYPRRQSPPFFKFNLILKQTCVQWNIDLHLQDSSICQESLDPRQHFLLVDAAVSCLELL